jgi:hypothetical protein
LHDNIDHYLANLTITDERGVRHVIHTTQNHPFWNSSTGKWTPAGQLHPGEHLGGRIAVVSIRKFAETQHMLNLTVADLHTYYVLAGTTPVLVHNECVSIYKAATSGMTDDIMENGFNPVHFPGSGNGYPDGRAYFGLHDIGKEIALDYASRGGYDNAVIHIRIPKAEFEQNFGRFVGKHNGVPNSEVSIPKEMFDQLNSYPRELITP